LREQLEEKLAGSLQKLRPAKTLTSSIMAAILTPSFAKATGAVMGTLAKFAPLKWIFPFFSMIFFLPTIFFVWLITRAELRNYREAKGFRARLFQERTRRQLLGMLIVMAAVWLCLPFIRTAYGPQTPGLFYFVLGAFSFRLCSRIYG
jgi:hypothetical protein